VAHKYDIDDKRTIERLIRKSKVPTDSWPYSDYFDSYRSEFNDGQLTAWSRQEFWRLVLAVRKKGTGGSRRKKTRSDIELTGSQRQALRSVMPRNRGGVDRLPYTSSFDSAYRMYLKRSRHDISHHEFWLAMLRLAKSRVRTHARPHLEIATDSLALAINCFNTISPIRRDEQVIIFLHHAFEHILKAGLIQNNFDIKPHNQERSIKFDKCCNVACSNEMHKFIEDPDRKYLLYLKGLRDLAYHDALLVDECELFFLAKIGVGLFDTILDDIFFERLADRLPARVLPVSTIAMTDIQVLLDRKLSQITDLIKGSQAQAARQAARSLAELELQLGHIGEDEIPDGSRHNKVDEIIHAAEKGTALSNVLPDCAAIELSYTGDGAQIHLNLSKTGRGAVQVGPDAESGVVALRRINPAQDFNLSHRDIANQVDISTTALTGIMRELNIHDRDDLCYKHGPSRAKSHQLGYHSKTIDVVRTFIAEHEGEDILTWHRKHIKKKRRSR